MLYVISGVPETPTNVELVDASSDKVTLRWTEGFNGGFASTEYLITYWAAAGSGRGRNESCRSQNVCEIIGMHIYTHNIFEGYALFMAFLKALIITVGILGYLNI